MNIIAITNQKGGCGKTTTAINLTAALAERGKKTLLVDLDPQAHATMGLGLRRVDVEKSTYSIFINESKNLKDIRELTTYIDENIDIVPSHIILSTVEHELKDKDNGILMLFRTLMYADINYDYILIDCPPNLGFLTFNALRAGTEIIIPVETSVFSIMGVSKLMGMVELIKLKLHHSPLVKGVITMYDPLTEFSQKMLNKIKNIFKENIFNSIITYDTALKEAQEKFVPIFKHNPECDGARDYLSLADEILNQEKEKLPDSLYKELQKILYSNVYSKERMFNFYAPDAKEVHVVGDFNDWKISDESCLSRKENGMWEQALYLDPGRYRYKFVVDGLYFEDPENPHKEPNPYGNSDSIFDI
ncbi:MAG: AAA family ATPase [Candidatus Omnitrophica bacterium]|nr:AAA family ATPase [Candidatus Omnitrophota bacterium]